MSKYQRTYTKFKLPEGNVVILCWRNEKDLTRYMKKFPEYILVDKSNTRFESYTGNIPAVCKSPAFSGFYNAKSRKGKII
ncbi:hypothetical protein [Paenibacillus sp. TH7-28]